MIVIIKYFINQENEFIKPNLHSKVFGYTWKELICCKCRCFHAPLNLHFPPVFFNPHACPPLLLGSEQLSSWPLLGFLFELAGRPCATVSFFPQWACCFMVIKWIPAVLWMLQSQSGLFHNQPGYPHCLDCLGWVAVASTFPKTSSFWNAGPEQPRLSQAVHWALMAEALWEVQLWCQTGLSADLTL